MQLGAMRRQVTLVRTVVACIDGSRRLYSPLGLASWGSHMSYRAALASSALIFLASSAALAQEAPPTYKGDPDVYRVIFENQDFRVIEAVRKKGVRDKLHSHPVPSVVYFLTDCKGQQFGADGKPVTPPNEAKAGTVRAVPIIKAHSAVNLGPEDCHQIFVERK